ncbi:MAG: ATP-grasp domain-containing protein [Marinilabiliales bacterium]|nr:MAG: ATP-grasp domain-containing protein [Marinilabiliales bacterium]
MILIDKPYVSDYLIKTIKDFKLQIIATKTAREMINDDSLNWINEIEAIKILENNPKHILYSNSENSINWVEHNLTKTKLPERIKLFKDKILFRELLKDEYPQFYFLGVKYQELRDINPKELNYPFIIKPAVGFFSIAVHKVNSKNEWQSVLDEIDSEMEKLVTAYPKEVIDGNNFIIEEIIPGEEYAVDCYFNDDGEVIILNIMKHVFSSDDDVYDRVYSTSKEIIQDNYDQIHKYIGNIGRKAKIKNFPAHIELRIDSNNSINAIEVNPMRFGGWCTSADLSWHAFQINTYDYVVNSKVPDWNELLKGKEGKKYSLIVLNNSSGIKEEEIKYFDYDLLLKDFSKPLEIRKTDYVNFTIFGFLFLETDENSEDELNEILNSNLRKYIS